MLHRTPIKLGKVLSILASGLTNSSLSQIKSKNELLVKADRIKLVLEKVNVHYMFSRLTEVTKYVANKSTSIAHCFSKSSSIVIVPNNYIEKKVHNFTNKNRSSNNLNAAKYSTNNDETESNCDEPGRHCYHEETETAMNKQILTEFNACYAYLSMSCYFARTDIALPGCEGFFMRMHEEEHGHALKLIKLQTLKGAQVHLYPITVPECQNWESIEKALAVSVDMEKLVKDSLMKLHSVAAKHNDLHIMDVLESEFIKEQDRSICELARLLKRVQSMGNSGLTEFLFDKEMHKVFVNGSIKKGIGVTSSTSESYV